MSYKSHVPGPTRYFDHLYDPLYVTSGRASIWRANRMALYKATPISILPVFQNMFTELTTQARNCYIPQQTQLPFPTTYRFSTKHIQVTNEHFHVRGANRAGYYTHANIPRRVEALPPLQAKLDNDECECYYEMPKSKDAQCQTMYRESSAQTNPWMPDAVIGDGANETPEIIEVAQLITSHTFPGLIEVEIIERARRKREWEAYLNKNHKPEDDWEQKKKTLEIIEWEELMAHEADIHNCQMQRLRIVSGLMRKREKAVKTRTEKMLESARRSIEKRNREQKLRLQLKHKSDLRKLELRFKGPFRKKKDVVQEHLNYGSDLYAPALIQGETGRSRNYVDLKSNYEPKFIKFNDIEVKAENAASILNARKGLWEPKREVRIVQTGFWNEHFLRKLYNSLQFYRLEAENIPRGPPKCLVPLATPIQSAPNTPTDFVEKENNERYEQAVFVQKILKGRCIQKLIHQNRNQLIGELQSTHQLSSIEQLFPEQKAIMEKWKEEIEKLKEEREILENKELMKQMLDEQGCTDTAQLIEFLGQELKRLQEQKKCQALYMLAEQERYKREAAALGKQQLDEKITRECEEMHRSIMKDNYDTATMYLENILCDGIDTIAENDSRYYIKKVAKRIDSQATKAIKTATPADKKETTFGLLNTFVIPELHKILSDEEQKSKQRARLVAAHDAIHNTIDEIIPIPSVNEILVSTIVDPIVDHVPATPKPESIESLTNEEIKVTAGILEDLITCVFVKRHGDIIDPIIDEMIDDSVAE